MFVVVVVGVNRRFFTHLDENPKLNWNIVYENGWPHTCCVLFRCACVRCVRVCEWECLDRTRNSPRALVPAYTVHTHTHTRLCTSKHHITVVSLLFTLHSGRFDFILLTISLSIRWHTGHTAHSNGISLVESSTLPVYVALCTIRVYVRALGAHLFRAHTILAFHSEALDSMRSGVFVVYFTLRAWLF